MASITRVVVCAAMVFDFLEMELYFQLLQIELQYTHL
jgi:hypothetical protein